jgi:hypothetical protein
MNNPPPPSPIPSISDPLLDNDFDFEEVNTAIKQLAKPEVTFT